MKIIAPKIEKNIVIEHYLQILLIFKARVHNLIED